MRESKTADPGKATIVALGQLVMQVFFEWVPESPTVIIQYSSNKQEHTGLCELVPLVPF